MNKGKHWPSARFIKTRRSKTFCTLGALVYIKAISQNYVFYMIASNQHGDFPFFLANNVSSLELAKTAKNVYISVIMQSVDVVKGKPKFPCPRLWSEVCFSSWALRLKEKHLLLSLVNKIHHCKWCEIQQSVWRSSKVNLFLSSYSSKSGDAFRAAALNL